MSSNATPQPPARRTNSSNYHKRGSTSLKRMPSSENGSAHTSKPTSPNSSTNGDRTVKRLRLSRALTIPEGTTVSDACRRMASRRVDAVLLTDSNALLSGIVTDKDVATRVIAEDLKPEETLISTIMTRNPTFVSADALAIEALQKMVQGKFRHLPVVDNGEVIAMLDITKCLYDAISKMEKAAEQGSAIAAAVEGVERQYGNSFSAPQGFLETLKERMFKPALSSIIDDDSKQAIVAPTDTIQAAAKIMQELRTNCVIVVSGSKIQGLLTSRDILMKVLAANLSPESTLAEKVMTSNPDCAKLDTTILEALHIMHNGKFLHIPVLDKDGSIVACIDVLQLTHAAISMVENSSGALNNVTNVMMQRFWDSAIASEQGDDFDTQSEMSMMLATEAAADLGKFPSPRFGHSSSSPRLGNSFSYKFVDNKGRLHRFDHTGSENLDELLATVVKRIGVDDDAQQNPYLLYEDDEGDKVVLTSDKDLTGAVAHARSRGQKVLRLHLDFTESCERAKPELATETVKGRKWNSFHSGFLVGATLVTSITVVSFLGRSKLSSLLT
ncbi:hypothetical protein V2J09_007793 [Rumex salicifolius]